MKVGNALNTFGKWDLILQSWWAYLLALGLLAVGVYEAWFAPAPPPPEKRKHPALVMGVAVALAALMGVIGYVAGKMSTAQGSNARTLRQIQLFL